MINEQAKVPENQNPKLLSTDITEKTESLKREVGYLVTKIKYFRPKTTKKPVTVKPTAANKTAEEQQQQQAKPSTQEEETPADERSEFDKDEIDDKQFAQDIFDKFDKENQETTTEDPEKESTPSPEL